MRPPRVSRERYEKDNPLQDTNYRLFPATGLNKGIRVLSDVNMNVYWVSLGVMVLFGPTPFNLNLRTQALGGYVTDVFRKSLMTGQAARDQWPQWWTTFYRANRMAWAPVSACFLGRGAGYHLRGSGIHEHTRIGSQQRRLQTCGRRCGRGNAGRVRSLFSIISSVETCSPAIRYDEL